MPDLTVIYDPALELAAIVDLDTLQGWGPVYKGPGAQEVLQGFIDTMPFDVSILEPDVARKAFWGFVENIVEGISFPEGQADQGQVGDVSQPAGPEEALATLEATHATGIPSAGPADSDPSEGPPDQTSAPLSPHSALTAPAVTVPPVAAPGAVGQPMNCGLCNMDGTGSTDPGCVACGGTGQLIRVQ